LDNKESDNYLRLLIMHIATCFDTKESTSGYSMNHNIDTSSDSAHSWIPKSLHRRIQVKSVHNYCPDVLNIYSNRLTVKKLKYN